MERRISARKLVDVNVFVSQPGQTTLCCRAVDISSSGVFLHTNPLYLPAHQQLDLVFAITVRSSNVVRMRHVSALVARSDSHGVGMVFCDSKSSRLQRDKQRIDK